MLRKLLAFLGLGNTASAPLGGRRDNASEPVAPGAHLNADAPAAATRDVAAPTSQIASMSVMLPPGRLRPGTLLALDVDGGLVSGPWPAIGRANAQFAASKGNPARSRTLPFGDVPTGTYELAGKSATPAGFVAAFGGSGALSFYPLDGEAAAAEAMGRTGLLLHGGSNWRASTDGSLRVPDLAMTEIFSLLPADPAPMRPRVRLSIRDSEDCDGWRANHNKGSKMRRIWARQFHSDDRDSSGDASSDSGMGDDDPTEGMFPSLFQLLYMPTILDAWGRDDHGKHQPPAEVESEGRAPDSPLTNTGTSGGAALLGVPDQYASPDTPNAGAYDR